MKKILTFAAMALLLGASVSCNHNEITPDSLSKSHRIGVRVTGVGTVTKAGADAPALIDSYVIEDFDGEDIKLDVYVEDNLNGLVPAPETKGGIIDDGTGYGININSKDVLPGGYFKIVKAADFNDEFNGKYEVPEYDIPTNNSVKRGDLNKDGKVSTADAVYLLRHTMRADRYPLNQSGDMNGDGNVNSADAVYLLRNVLRGSEKYPLAD